MPESVSDRPTSSHEYVFLLAKSATYFYDAEAIREQATYAGPNGVQHSPYAQGFGRRSPEEETARQAQQKRPSGWASHDGAHGSFHRDGRERKQDLTAAAAAAAGGSSGRRMNGFNDRWDDAEANGRVALGRNKRSVWDVATHPYPEAHFATFPPKLIEPMVLAGCPRQVCGVCSAPWKRKVDIGYANPGNRKSNGPRSTERKHLKHGSAGCGQRLEKVTETLGWEATCGCNDSGSAMGVVLDPFVGSGTTLQVAIANGRNAIGIELNPEYADLARQRLVGVTPSMFDGT